MMQTAAVANQSAGTTGTADIQLLVLDIDGTIAGESNQISEPVLRAIQAAQAKGIQVALATGRMYRSALRFHQAIGSTLPLTCYQGALIQDPATGRVHRHLPVSHHLAKQLLEHFQEPELRSVLSVHVYLNDRLYVREITPASKAYGERTGVEPIPVGDLRQFLTAEPTKILALCDDVAVIDNLLGTLRQRYTPAELYMTTSVATFFEATHPAVNKGTAVRYLAEQLLGLSPANVMAIGDNFNDVEMLAYAGTGVAMGNAPAGVQAVASWVAPNVDKDGAAAAIEEFLL
jgi:Cof subfamily protein (haloacid dehalogenase superfamily)